MKLLLLGENQAGKTSLLNSMRHAHVDLAKVRTPFSMRTRVGHVIEDRPGVRIKAWNRVGQRSRQSLSSQCLIRSRQAPTGVG